MDKLSKMWTPKKKRSKYRRTHPSEIGKFLCYPSAKTLRWKHADGHNPSGMAFWTPSEIHVHRGGGGGGGH
jgi:hypothetical protein